MSEEKEIAVGQALTSIEMQLHLMKRFMERTMHYDEEKEMDIMEEDAGDPPVRSVTGSFTAPEIPDGTILDRNKGYTDADAHPAGGPEDPPGKLPFPSTQRGR